MRSTRPGRVLVQDVEMRAEGLGFWVSGLGPRVFLPPGLRVRPRTCGYFWGFRADSSDCVLQTKQPIGQKPGDHMIASVLVSGVKYPDPETGPSRVRVCCGGNLKH